MCWFTIKNAGLQFCGVRQNLHVYSIYRNPDLDNQIFYCLLASLALLRTSSFLTLSIRDTPTRKGVSKYSKSESAEMVWACGKN